MTFENLLVNRIAVHEIFQRADRALVPPAFGTALETLSAEAMDVFRRRTTEALATKAMEMSIVKQDAGSFVVTAASLQTDTDAQFLQRSQRVATMLAEAQTQRNIPGGMLMVFDGTVGGAHLPFIAVLKAETQSGFRKTAPQSRMQFFNDLFLTPTTRLYKVGMMVHHDAAVQGPNGWSAFIFDSNISPAHREDAAIYFYDTFLGCQLKSDAPYDTAKFFDLTKEFIRRTELGPEQKQAYMDTLNVFIRDVHQPTFTKAEFADTYLPVELQDSFSRYLEVNRFTDHAVVRDLSAMGNRLRRRRYKFGAGVELSVATEARGKVEIRPIEGAMVDGVPEVWTQVIIKEPLTGEA